MEVLIPHNFIDPEEAAAALAEASEPWYKPGKSMAEFHAGRGKILIRVLIGGRGCGKTTGIAAEALEHGFHNAGAKAYCLRKTQLSNEDTTLDTFEEVFSKSGTAYQESSISLFKKIDGGKTFRLPSRRAVELWNEHMLMHPTKIQTQGWLDSVGNRFCSWIQFAGVPTKAVKGSRFRGFECSLLVFVEADQLDEEDLDLGMACLRWKGADPSVCDSKGFIKERGVILDTNPPGLTHWIAAMEKSDKYGRKQKFWHIPTQENEHNLPDDYVENLKRAYAKKPAMYDRMVLGLYADAFDGDPVFYNFTQENAAEHLDFPRGAYLIRGWDFGTKNAVIWSAYWSVTEQIRNEHGLPQTAEVEYWWDLLEHFAEQSDTDRQCKAVVALTDEVFPFWNDRSICSGIRDYCDVAGRQRKDTGSSIKVLNTYRVYPGSKVMGLQQSIAVCNRLYDKRDRSGHLVYMIDKVSCPRLYRALSGGYRYPTVSEPGYGSDDPMKDGTYDHLADAQRYAKYNCMRLLVAEVAARNDAVGKLAQRKSVNPLRRYW